MGRRRKYIAVPVGRFRKWSNKVNSKYLNWFVIEPKMHETMLLIGGFMLEAYILDILQPSASLPSPSLSNRNL